MNTLLTPARLGLNPRILLQVSAPAVLIGMLLFGVCLVSAWHVNRLQSNLSEVLAQNVSSMQAAYQLEIHMRQVRFRYFLYLSEPNPELLTKIAEAEALFEARLRKAQEVAQSPEEKEVVQAVGVAYTEYQRGLQEQLRRADKLGPVQALYSEAKNHPIKQMTVYCEKYAALNEEMMAQTRDDSAALSKRLHVTMLLLGLGGPLAGLIGGYGIARGLSRSLYRLSVRVQDMAQSLETDIGAVSLTPEGDVQRLDEQLDHVVQRVAEVTEQMQRQQREMLRAQQLAAVGQLAASVAHEIRNPLTSIKMLVEASIRLHKPKPLTEENARVIDREIRRLEQTVQGFLDFARPPALQRQADDLRLVLTQATDLVQARARQLHVTIRVKLPPEPIVATVDHQQLRSVFVNLLINALDALPRGGTIEIALARTTPAEVTCTVVDSGEGIPPEVERVLFTPFTSTKATGSGLGLSVCKRIVEAHGGTIRGANRAEGGACFSVVLPVAPE